MAQRSSDRIERRSDDASDATRSAGRKRRERNDRSGGSRKRRDGWRRGTTLSNDVGNDRECADKLLLSRIPSKSGMWMHQHSKRGMYNRNRRAERSGCEGSAENQVRGRKRTSHRSIGTRSTVCRWGEGRWTLVSVGLGEINTIGRAGARV